MPSATSKRIETRLSEYSVTPPEDELGIFSRPSGIAAIVLCVEKLPCSKSSSDADTSAV